MEKKQSVNNINANLVVPDGGWGYVVTIAASFIFIITFIQITTFGIIYGSFLADVGDEAGGTSLVNGIFLTTASFTGLVANVLLQRISTRKVVLLGSAVFILGGLLNIFVTSTFYLVVSFGIIQGFGYGLLNPSLYTILNAYFEKKRALIVSIINVVLIASSTLHPVLANSLMDFYGFRGSLAILTAVCFNCIPAGMCFQPVKWHMKKQLTSVNSQQAEIKSTQSLPNLEEKLLEEVKRDIEMKDVDTTSKLLTSNLDNENKEIPKKNIWVQLKSMVTSLDLALFKDPVYVNISVGISLSLTSDLLFVSMIPLLTQNAGFLEQDQTLIFTVFFLSDLVGRILLSVFLLFITVPARLICLIGVSLLVVLRIAFVLYSSFWWITVTIALLGFLRCTLQTVYPLIFVEVYKDRFVTSFSLFMVVSGVTYLICGPLIALVKSVTKSNTAAIQVLTVAYLCCCVPWTIEMIYFRTKRNKLSKT